MSDGMRDANPLDVDTSDRGIAISEFYATGWNPGKLGPLLTSLYDAGYLRRNDAGEWEARTAPTLDVERCSCGDLMEAQWVCETCGERKELRADAKEEW